MAETQASSKSRGHGGGRLAPALLVALALLSAGVQAGSPDECFGEDAGRRIAACSQLVGPGVAGDRLRSEALAARAFAYASQGAYAAALEDLNAALALDPTSSAALNNRAWTLMKLGRNAEAEKDVASSLRLDPASAHARDTLAHVLQQQGRAREALGHYEAAMRLGGRRFIKLYQCGLAAAGLYTGPPDGIGSARLSEALERCVAGEGCDPLPPGEDCREPTS